MCRFKSGIILKNKIVLCPEGNESHSDLLEKLDIKDDHFNASKVFVRAELLPVKNSMSHVERWTYKVDQDIVPDWYEKDRERYEEEFRNEVKAWVKEHINPVEEFGQEWTVFEDEDNGLTYHVLLGSLTKIEFGETNDYKTSYVRKYLKDHELTKQIEEKYGDKLVKIDTDLTSMDGFKDYDVAEDDTLAIMTVPFLMKYGEKIPLISIAYWLATPNQTEKRGDLHCVRVVHFDGDTGYYGYGWDRGVRPFSSQNLRIFQSDTTF